MKKTLFILLALTYYIAVLPKYDQIEALATAITNYEKNPLPGAEQI